MPAGGTDWQPLPQHGDPSRKAAADDTALQQHEPLSSDHQPAEWHTIGDQPAAQAPATHAAAYRSRWPVAASCWQQDGTACPARQQYRIVLHTSDLPGAGDAAAVHLTLHGTCGSGTRHWLLGGRRGFGRCARGSQYVEGATIGACGTGLRRRGCCRSTCCVAAGSSCSVICCWNPFLKPDRAQLDPLSAWDDNEFIHTPTVSTVSK